MDRLDRMFSEDFSDSKIEFRPRKPKWSASLDNLTLSCWRGDWPRRSKDLDLDRAADNYACRDLFVLITASNGRNVAGAEFEEWRVERDGFPDVHWFRCAADEHTFVSYDLAEAIYANWPDEKVLCPLHFGNIVMFHRLRIAAVSAPESRHVWTLLRGLSVWVGAGRSDFFLLPALSGSHTHFRRDPEVHRKTLDEFSERTGGNYRRFNYLGEWHSHPSFSVHPSVEDIETMTDIVENGSSTITFAALLIVRVCGGDCGSITRSPYLQEARHLIGWSSAGVSFGCEATNSF